MSHFAIVVAVMAIFLVGTLISSLLSIAGRLVRIHSTLIEIRATLERSERP